VNVSCGGRHTRRQEGMTARVLHTQEVTGSSPVAPAISPFMTLRWQTPGAVYAQCVDGLTMNRERAGTAEAFRRQRSAFESTDPPAGGTASELRSARLPRTAGGLSRSRVVCCARRPHIRSTCAAAGQFCTMTVKPFAAA
jgi:hypothetical protein